MNNVIIASILSLFFILTLVTSVHELLNIKKIRSVKFLFCVSLAVLLWLLFCILLYVDTNVERIYYWHVLRYTGICMISTMYVLFLVTHLFPMLKISAISVANICIVPVLSVLIAITNNQHYLFYKHQELVELSPIVTMDTAYGFCFYIHTAYSYIMILVSFFVLFYAMKKTPRAYWRSAIVFSIAIFVSVIVNFLSVLSVLPFGNVFDYSLLGAAISHYLCYVVVLHSNRSDLMMLFKDTVFENQTTAIVVLDDKKTVIKLNKAAQTILGKKHFEGTISELFESCWDYVEIEIAKEFDGGHVIMVDAEHSHTGTKKWYRITETEIIDDRGKSVGFFNEIHDVSEQQDLISQLFIFANVDNLTKTYNRRYYDNFCSTLNRDNEVNLGVVIADLNGLKIVNDTFGHEVGDKLIIEAGNILGKHLPSHESIVCRIGGDEFVVLIPEANESIMQEYINLVNKTCEEEEFEYFGNVSMAMGYEIKLSPKVSVEEVVKVADAKMYSAKQELYKKRNEKRDV